MPSLVDKIVAIELARRKEKLLQGLDRAYEIISSEIKEDHKLLFQNDFEVFRTGGRFWIHNTFAGGIIFLREPETIVRISIDFNSISNSASAAVEYGSEIRNKRNTKYKPDASKIESTEWKMLGVFPHFNRYDMEIQLALITLIGNFVKTICEDLNQNSWFMKYERSFNVEVLLDNKIIRVIPVKAI